MIPKVEALGFECFPSGTDAGLAPRRLPLLPVDPARELEAATKGFGRQIPRERARDLLATCERWRPDVVVWESTDVAGPLAAERLGLVHASVLVLAADAWLEDAMFESVGELRDELGLPPDADGTMRTRYLVLAPFPPSYRDPASPLPSTARAIRPSALDPAAADTLPAWFGELPAAPVVYVTFGSVFPLESGDLFARVVAGVRELPVNLIVAVGPDIDPAELGPQPANVHVERWIPQPALLPRCDVMVSHGGSGSVVGALAHGVPLVVIPMGADQPQNAARCAALGVARVLDPIAATPESIREAVAAVLLDPAYREAVGRLRDEASALPGPGHAVGLLERLVRERRPLLD